MNLPADEQLKLFLMPAEAPDGCRHHPRSLASSDGEEGGAFNYASAPEVFLGRAGLGPLRVAVDTNVLIDYGSYGQSIWEGHEPSSELRGKRLTEMTALYDLVNHWMTRDNRFHVFSEHLSDFKRTPSTERDRLRRRQVKAFDWALTAFGHGPPSIPNDAPGAWPSELVLDCIPGKWIEN